MFLTVTALLGTMFFCFLTFPLAFPSNISSTKCYIFIQCIFASFRINYFILKFPEFNFTVYWVIKCVKQIKKFVSASIVNSKIVILTANSLYINSKSETKKYLRN